MVLTLTIKERATGIHLQDTLSTLIREDRQLADANNQSIESRKHIDDIHQYQPVSYTNLQWWDHNSQSKYSGQIVLQQPKNTEISYCTHGWMEIVVWIFDLPVRQLFPTPPWHKWKSVSIEPIGRTIEWMNEWMYRHLVRRCDIRVCSINNQQVSMCISRDQKV